MKKVLKVTALALAIAAVLLGCKSPVNDDNNEKKSVGPNDVKAPEGYEFTEGATSVTNAEEGKLFFGNGDDLYFISTLPLVDLEDNFGKFMSKEEADKIQNQLIEKDSANFNCSKKSIDLQNEKIGKIYGKLDLENLNLNFTKITVEDNKFSVFQKCDYNWYLSDSRKCRIPFSSIVSAISDSTYEKTSEGITNYSSNEVMIFNNDYYKGILLIKADINMNQETPELSPVIKSLTFYDLDGKPTYTYTKDEIKNLNELLAPSPCM